MPKKYGQRSNYSKKENGQREYTFKKPINMAQKWYIDLIKENKITFCAGPPGCGKTMLALQVGLEMLRDKKINKIYYIRNNIDYKALGSLGTGYTSGDFKANEKAKPLLMPIFTNIYQLVCEDKANVLINKEVIQPLILDMIQGMTFFYNYVIIDEAENIPPLGIKMLLTRLGQGSKLVFIGDSDQKCTKDSHVDGLLHAMRILRGMENCGIMSFKSEHSSARDELIPEINRRYKNNPY